MDDHEDRAGGCLHPQGRGQEGTGMTFPAATWQRPPPGLTRATMQPRRDSEGAAVSIPVPDEAPQRPPERLVPVVLVACLIPMFVGLFLVVAGQYFVGYLIGTSASLAAIGYTTIKIHQLRIAHKEALRQFDEWAAKHG